MTKHTENEEIPYEPYFSVDFTLRCGICPKTFATTRGECVIMNCCKTLVHKPCVDYHIQAKNICPRCCGNLQYAMFVSAGEEQQLFDFLNDSMNNLLCEEGKGEKCDTDDKKNKNI